MTKELHVILYYLKPNKKNHTIYHKPYVWKTTFENAKKFNEDDVVPFVGNDNHKHYAFVYKKEIHELNKDSEHKWLIPYKSKDKTKGRKLKRLFYDDWKNFKRTRDIAFKCYNII